MGDSEIPKNSKLQMTMTKTTKTTQTIKSKSPKSSISLAESSLSKRARRRVFLNDANSNLIELPFKQEIDSKTIKSSSTKQVSGKKIRNWKRTSDVSANAVNKDSGSNTTWRKKEIERQDKEAMNNTLNSIRESKRQEYQSLKDKYLEKKKRKEENREKNSIVQEISSIKKIRKMSAKDRKLLRKADKTRYTHV